MHELLDLFLNLDVHLEAFVQSHGAWVYGLLFLIIFLLVNLAAGQERSSPIPLAFSQEPSNCETNHARLDSYATYLSHWETKRMSS